MSYRIEVSKNNRAGCTDTLCKAQGVKITKGEIRLGSWVEVNDHGGWKWRHWGCVSGLVIENIRDKIAKGEDDYDFDAIDGFDELEDPEIQEKVRRVVTQGHIDPEDFNGVSVDN
ncbi:zf-PARP-domain-containing protein [Phialemonium atrogriseum]|uniref:Zf-PARP-domain-containing protein n=1 Tax=Phialemonium atrogriseum TaxID=1093897 RepID=A0AAJ0C2D5_9PEZI|nr:zf-PARP-domain-containing protein [Phialemonium atrogriseum]KAK1768890.1 zf-PARP-domain-containing protein [Phialemonium atrogriseum]